MVWQLVLVLKWQLEGPNRGVGGKTTEQTWKLFFKKIYKLASGSPTSTSRSQRKILKEYCEWKFFIKSMSMSIGIIGAGTKAKSSAKEQFIWKAASVGSAISKRVTRWE